MKFVYCPECGNKLIAKDLGDDLGVPWCDKCNKPWFPMFPAAIIALVYNDDGEVLLLRQSYISSQFHNLISGYILPGESAEECARREIMEETGLEVDRLELVFTDWFVKKDIMMIGFIAFTRGHDVRLSQEVDSAEWIPEGNILEKLNSSPTSTSRRLAKIFISSRGFLQ